MDWARAPPTFITVVLHSVSETHPMEINDIVEMQVATEERYQSMVENDTVLKFYESNDTTVEEIVEASPQVDSAYEKAIRVLKEAKNKINSLIRDDGLKSLPKEIEDRVRMLESNCIDV